MMARNRTEAARAGRREAARWVGLWAAGVASVMGAGAACGGTWDECLALGAQMVGWSCAAGIYLLPSVLSSGHRDRALIVTVNVLLGWTLVGWCVALVWAVKWRES